MNVTNRLGFLSLALALSACGGGGSSSAPSPAPTPTPAPPPPPPPPELTAKAYVAGSGSDAVMALDNGNGATIDYWLQTDAKGTRLPAQTLLKDGKGAAVRSFYDAQGDLTRIVDDKTGRAWSLSWSDSQLIATEVDGAGNALSAYLVRFSATGKLTITPVLGKSAVTGQITGQVSGAQTAAFALTPASVGVLPGMVLGTETVLPDGLQGMLPKKAAAVSLLVPARFAMAGTDTGFDWVGEAWKVALPSWTQRNRTTLLTGFVLGAACAGLVPGCQALGVGVSATSLGLLVGGWVAQQGGEKLINEVRNDQGQALLGDSAPSALETLRGRLGDAWRRGGDMVQELQDSARTLATGGSLTPVGDMRTARSDPGTRSPAGYTQPSTLPATGSLPQVDTQLTGMLASTAGETYGVSGTVGKDGRLTVSGRQDGGSTSVTVQGALSGGALTGNYSDSFGRTGSVSGADEALGQCQTQTESGGQGSFSYAYAMGAAGGAVSLTYQMYSIPDRMDVYALDSSGRHLVFSTGGLVSGSSTLSLTLQPQTTLFVAMTAPNSGTAWTFDMSCPK